VATDDYDMFLTHDWGAVELGRDNHACVALANTYLQRAGTTAWFDAEQMRGDVNAKMADGVVRSKCVAVFITKRYVQKASGLGPNGNNDNSG